MATDRPFINSPFDTQNVSYSLGGQMSPEAAMAEQALNRRRLLANMLVQQGLQPAQGRMAGRFYVAPNPLQGVAGLTQVLMGSLGHNYIDDEQKEVIEKDAKDKDKFIAGWHAKQKLLNAMSQAPVGAAPSQAPPMAPEQAHLPPPQGVEEAGLQVSGKPIPPEMLRNIGPRPQATQGAVPMLPDVRPQEATPAQLGPIQRNPSNAFSGDLALGYPAPNTVPPGTNPSGLSQDVTPGDMSTMVNSADPAKAQAQMGEQPPMPPPAQVAPPAPAPVQPPMQPGPPRKTTMEDLAALMTHNHPQVRAYGQFLAQQMQREQERADQQAFMKDEKDTNRAFLASQNEQNRAVQREGLSSKLDNMMMLGLITKDQKDAALAQQAQQAKMTNEIAKGNQEIARMNAQTQRLQIEQGKTPPGYRKTADGNLEAVPGGPADLKKQGIYNQDIGMLNSATANMDRLASSAHQILNHPGLKGITGLRGALPDVPGTDAANARALLQTMKSQIAFDVLQEMRNNSKTGGALGNVSDAEGKRLEANLAALDASQSPEQFKAQLQQILTYVDGAKSRMREAFNMKHGDAEGKAKGESPKVERSLDELLKKYGN